MKREIKFRGRSVHGGWFYGDLLHYTNPLLPSKINGGAIIVTDYTSESDNKFKIINPDTIGQYTGLKDKNGKEIYEHDLIEVMGIISEVVYNDKLGAYTLFELKTHNLGRKALGVMMVDFPDMIVIDKSTR